MAEVTYEKTSPVTGRLQLSIPKEEISRKLNDALKKEGKKANIRGFRKGKTPMSALRKLMGNQMLGPILDRTIQEELYGYIDENDIKLIFSPLPDESEPVEQITATRLADLNLAYDLALEPDFEVQLPEQTFTQYVLEVDEEEVDKQIDNLRRQFGENEDVEEGTVEDTDLIHVSIQEIDGELVAGTSFYGQNLSETYQGKFIGAEIGSDMTVEDLTEFEDGLDADYVKKYYLELEDEEAKDYDLEGKQFQVTINKVGRIEPAEMDEELFIKYDPEGEITSEEELRESIVEQSKTGFQRQGEGMVGFEIQRALVEGNEFELPTELMRRISQGESDQEFERFERGIRWMLIRNKLVKKYDLTLGAEDLRAIALEKLLGMLGGQRPPFVTDEFVDNYVQRLLADEQQRDELQTEAIDRAVMAKLRAEVDITEQALSSEAFNDTIIAFNEANAPEEDEEE